MVRVSSPAKLRPWSELTAKMVMGVVPGLVKREWFEGRHACHLWGARVRARSCLDTLGRLDSRDTFWTLGRLGARRGPKTFCGTLPRKVQFWGDSRGHSLDTSGLDSCRGAAGLQLLSHKCRMPHVPFPPVKCCPIPELKHFVLERASAGGRVLKRKVLENSETSFVL